MTEEAGFGGLLGSGNGQAAPSEDELILDMRCFVKVIGKAVEGIILILREVSLGQIVRADHYVMGFLGEKSDADQGALKGVARRLED